MFSRPVEDEDMEWNSDEVTSESSPLKNNNIFRISCGILVNTSIHSTLSTYILSVGPIFHEVMVDGHAFVACCPEKFP